MSTIQNRRRGGIALGAAGIALASSVMMAAPASAHVPQWQVDCDSVSVNLKWYAEQGNTVTLTADGEEIISQEFGGNFHETDVPLPKHSQPIDVRLVVVASDDEKYNVDETKTSPVCEGEEPTPTPSTPSEEPTPSPEPSTSEPAEPTPSPSTSSPAAEPTVEESQAPKPDTDLAETGSSSSTPLIAGIAAAVVAAGAGLLLMARKRRSVKG